MSYHVTSSGENTEFTKIDRRDLQQLAQDYTQEALGVLAEIMRSKKATSACKLRMMAALAFLDRGHGKPVQMTIDLRHTKELNDLTPTPQLIATLGKDIQEIQDLHLKLTHKTGNEIYEKV